MHGNNRISVIIAARMGSSRFPGKTLTDLHGKPMLERIIERIRSSKYCDDIIVATTFLEEDEAIENWCAENQVHCFRGSDDDVLERLYKAADHYNCKTIVEILGDNPLVHSDLIDACVDKYFSDTLDYVATITNEYPKASETLKKFPIGVRVQVMSTDTLKKCDELANEQNFREHATSYIAQNPDIFKTGFVEASGPFNNCNNPELTFAVNLEKNLVLIENIFNACYSANNTFSVADAIEVFKKNNWISLMGND